MPITHEVPIDSVFSKYVQNTVPATGIHDPKGKSQFSTCAEASKRNRTDSKKVSVGGSFKRSLNETNSALKAYSAEAGATEKEQMTIL
ncbi:hypothetical protein EVAR_33035_1 [Eumeta japonica]|uniref:Uncharacterized protein n=1 Tax=Eumeta variegata TaxID=151549 RepID=A0A4C1VSJ6_EUMVA|nr:hypothetical protein EVAR_33035_1 [Eumeta japonica]